MPLFFAIAAAASGNLFPMRLKSSNIFAPPLEWNIGLMSSRSLRESSPTFGVRIAITGRFALIASSCKFSAVKHSRTSVNARQPQIRLVDPIQPDRLVIIHARKRRLDRMTPPRQTPPSRNPSTTSHTRSGCGYVISKSICVNSGWRSARKSSSRKQRTI